MDLFGSCNNNVFVKGTNRDFLERSSMSSLPYGIDDPKTGKSKSKTNQLDVSELVVDLLLLCVHSKVLLNCEFE